MADNSGGSEPRTSRPQMAGYGVPGSLEGALPWEWALERLGKSHNYWLTTVRPDGAPHTRVVWAIWLGGAYYLSTSANSRKGRNLQHNSNCVVCNENAEEAVIMEGVARKLSDSEIPPQAFTDYKAKYGWELDPKMGPVFEVRPRVVFAMPEKQFPMGATRWEFEYLRSIDTGETCPQPRASTMPKGSSDRLAESSIERKLSMSKEAAHHHAQAAEHHEHAARHHREAASHHEAGDHEKAAHHAHVAHGHHAHASHHATEAAKAHTEDHGSK